MAVLRPVEERDAKGNTIRTNPTTIFKADREIRKIVGRHDWALVENPDAHETVTVQVQDGKILFFHGVPDSTPTRKAAKEIDVKDVPTYIIDTLKRNPIKVREARPTVYEIKIATIGDVETAQVAEVPNDGQSVTVEPIEPDINPVQRAGRAARSSVMAEA